VCYTHAFLKGTSIYFIVYLCIQFPTYRVNGLAVTRSLGDFVSPQTISDPYTCSLKLTDEMVVREIIGKFIRSIIINNFFFFFFLCFYLFVSR
jgi:hypothetical protein